MALVQKSFTDLITFTRASGGGRFNAQGQYEWLPANTPRIDYDPVTGECLGLLVEDQRTNLLTYSRDLTNPVWIRENVTPAGQVDGIGGPASATILAENAGGTFFRLRRSGMGVTAGSPYCIGLVVAKYGRRYVYIRAGHRNAYLENTCFDLDAGAVVHTPSGWTSGVTPLGNGFFFIWTSTTATVSGSADFGLMTAAAAVTTNAITSHAADPAKGVIFGGAQLEAGSFPTSYIPTTDAQVTRAADVASVNTLSPWFNPEQGTLFVEAGMSSSNLPNWRRVLELAASGSSYIASFQTNNANGLSIYSLQDGVARTAVSTTSRGSNNKMAVAWDAGSLSGAVNGGAPASLSLPRTVTPVSLCIGGSIMTNYAWSGHIRSIRYFPRRLSGAELQAMTQ